MQPAEPTGEQDSPRHIVPFYSERTLATRQVLVKDLRDGLAVYVSEDRGFATIGTRGIRPLDRTPGLIIHLSVHLDDTPQTVVLDMPFHNLAYTPASAGQLMDLLIGTLEQAALVPPGSTAGSREWHIF